MHQHITFFHLLPMDIPFSLVITDKPQNLNRRRRMLPAIATT